MGEIDEVHQAERHGEAAGQHEQQHAVGDTVEQDGEERGHGVGLAKISENTDSGTKMITSPWPGLSRPSTSSLMEKERRGYPAQGHGRLARSVLEEAHGIDSTRFHLVTNHL